MAVLRRAWTCDPTTCGEGEVLLAQDPVLLPQRKIVGDEAEHILHNACGSKDMTANNPGLIGGVDSEEQNRDQKIDREEDIFLEENNDIVDAFEHGSRRNAGRGR
ncbi:MAG: hypothetical protein H6Q31_2250 [Bacteroidetes bacterium]|nr:hypothetical protein [Bacteroidota bacterium]